jgi:hypothetical protein
MLDCTNVCTLATSTLPFSAQICVLQQLEVKQKPHQQEKGALCAVSVFVSIVVLLQARKVAQQMKGMGF